MSEIMCYNHECRGDKDWCCLEHKECIDYKNCEYYKELQEHLKRRYDK